MAAEGDDDSERLVVELGDDEPTPAEQPPPSADQTWTATPAAPPAATPDPWNQQAVPAAVPPTQPTSIAPPGSETGPVAQPWPAPEPMPEPRKPRGRTRRAFAAVGTGFRGAWRRRRAIGVSLLAIALFAAGTLAGWTLRSTRSEPEVTVSVDRPVEALAAGPAADVGAPNLLGLDEETARQVLFDAGLTDEQIDVVAVPAAGPEGQVVSQEPSPGVPVEESIEISTSEATEVPDLVGDPGDEALQALEDLGARVVLQSEYQDNVDEGTVLAIAPAPGETLPVEVTVTQASAPSSVFLAALPALESDCGSDDVQVAGQEQPSSLLCDASSDGRFVDYLLDGSIARFEAVVGQTDDSEQGFSARFVVIADGATVIDQTVPYGESIPVGADVAGVLRLQIVVTVPSADCCPDVTGAVGSARLIGSTEAVDGLIAAGES